MALERTFRELLDQLQMLHDMLLGLRLTVMEDKPVTAESALVDHLEDAILDVTCTLDECLKAAGTAQRATGHPVDLDGARCALASCQEQFHRIETHYSERLASYEELKDLASLGRGRRGEWIPWAASVKSGIEQCRQPLEGTRKALGTCWQEIAERVGTTSVSVRTSNIGQKIVTKSTLDEIVVEGLI